MTRTYMGCHLTRATKPGVMRWGTYVGDRFLYADTLAGIKQLIRESKP